MRTRRAAALILLTTVLAACGSSGTSPTRSHSGGSAAASGLVALLHRGLSAHRSAHVVLTDSRARDAQTTADVTYAVGTATAIKETVVVADAPTLDQTRVVVGADGWTLAPGAPCPGQDPRLWFSYRLADVSDGSASDCAAVNAQQSVILGHLVSPSTVVTLAQAAPATAAPVGATHVELKVAVSRLPKVFSSVDGEFFGVDTVALGLDLDAYGVVTAERLTYTNDTRTVTQTVAFGPFDQAPAISAPPTSRVTR